MKTFKGFNKDLTCRGFQYEVGKTYEEDKVEACKSGFHACEYPLDCFSYYPPNSSVYHAVEQTGELSKDGYNSKVASSQIKIGEEVGIHELVKAAIEYTTSFTEHEDETTGDYGAASATGIYGAASATGKRGAASATGKRGAASATGICGAASATGIYGAASATGDCGAASATGIYGAASATGKRGAASATGICGAASATGDYGAASATGIYGAASATGDCGAASATGIYGAASAKHPTAVAIAWGYNSKAKGVIGSFLVFADWVNNEGCWTLKGAKMVQVDGEIIKADTYYSMADGEIVEVYN